MPDTTIIDLGDFIPQRFSLKFTIQGRRYVFEYPEATVDEVLRFMEQNKKKDAVTLIRDSVTEFLCRHAEGATDLAQLRKDLESVPFKSGRGALSIKMLHAAIEQTFIPKKALGAEKAPQADPQGEHGSHAPSPG